MIADGRSFGVVKSFDTSGSAPSMVFDLEEFFTGEAANQAARDDGVLGQNETLPNDYYIRNANPRLRTLPAAADVQIVIVDWEHCCGSIPGEIAPFAHGFTVDNHAMNYHGSDSPYWLTVEGGVVVMIEEQYLP